MKAQNISAAPSAKADYERSILEHEASSWTLENKRHLGKDVQLAETLNTLWQNQNSPKDLSQPRVKQRPWTHVYPSRS